MKKLYRAGFVLALLFSACNIPQIMRQGGENYAVSMLRLTVKAEEVFRQRYGRYGTREELIKEGLVLQSSLPGAEATTGTHIFTVTVGSNGFCAQATRREIGVDLRDFSVGSDGLVCGLVSAERIRPLPCGQGTAVLEKPQNQAPYDPAALPTPKRSTR